MLVLVNAQSGGISLQFNQIDTSWRIDPRAARPKLSGPRATEALVPGSPQISVYTMNHSGISPICPERSSATKAIPASAMQIRTPRAHTGTPSTPTNSTSAITVATALTVLAWRSDLPFTSVSAMRTTLGR